MCATIMRIAGYSIEVEVTNQRPGYSYDIKIAIIKMAVSMSWCQDRVCGSCAKIL